MEELIGFVDTNFRTLANQPNRALAGLSMGGMQTRAIGLKHTDKFSHLGIFSGGSIAPTEIADMAAFKKRVKLVFVSYGSKEGGATTAKPNVDALAAGRGEERLLRVTRDRTRVAELASQSVSVRATAVPGLTRCGSVPRSGMARGFNSTFRLSLDELGGGEFEKPGVLHRGNCMGITAGISIARWRSDSAR